MIQRTSEAEIRAHMQRRGFPARYFDDVMQCVQFAEGPMLYIDDRSRCWRKLFSRYGRREPPPSRKGCTPVHEIRRPSAPQPVIVPTGAVARRNSGCGAPCAQDTRTGGMVV